MNNSLRSPCADLDVAPDQITNWKGDSPVTTPKSTRLTLRLNNSVRGSNSVSNCSLSSGRYARQHLALFDQMKSIEEMEQIRKERFAAMQKCSSERLMRLALPKEIGGARSSNKNSTSVSKENSPLNSRASGNRSMIIDRSITPVSSIISLSSPSRATEQKTNMKSLTKNASKTPTSLIANRPQKSRFATPPMISVRLEHLSKPKNHVTPQRPQLSKSNRNTPLCVPRRGPSVDANKLRIDKTDRIKD